MRFCTHFANAATKAFVLSKLKNKHIHKAAFTMSNNTEINIVNFFACAHIPKPECVLGLQNARSECTFEWCKRAFGAWTRSSPGSGLDPLFENTNGPKAETT
jgi:hypothetical protein